MNRQRFVRTVVLVASAGWLAGCAAKAAPVADEHAYWQRVAMSLKDSTRPRDQALAAQLLDFTLMGSRDGTQAKAAADYGAESAISDLLSKVTRSDDAVALSIATQMGVKRQDQRASSTAGRWQAVESDNFAPRLFAGTPIEAVLEGARDATRYESHGYEQVRLMMSVFNRRPMDRTQMGSGPGSALTDSEARNEARAALSAFALWTAYANPAFQRLTMACRDEALLSTPTRRGDCLHVARLMAAKSGYVLTRSIGIGMLARAAASPQDIALAATLHRNNEWQRHQYFVVLMQGMEEPEQLGEMLRLLKTAGVGNEIQLLETALREKGIALTPPEDWQPPRRG